MTPPVVLAATAKHSATLIFLHGLGDTGQGWAQAMNSVREPFVKVICPTAHTIPVTLNAGFRMPSWFDLKTLDESGPEDEEGIRNATVFVHNLINKEISGGIPSDRIMLGGFSQGAALALYSAMTFTHRLAGVVALSGWLPLRKHFPEGKKCPDGVPILQCHGDCDPVVPYKWGQMTASALKALTTNSDFKSYRGLMHNSNDEELRDIKAFISKHLPSQ
ncbi:acyl-protein thioesterase 1 [Sitophilus oryzae]|uniref:palmitoyl-protein hydrolase n=1 Tax=Sitophilus oryzae TaxID=7048 RepID=A0A6J2YTJ7_SITOR|nr:acyl-protein thioesterase 1 [Sitophilus oryzae]